jgi:hypothetical protein
MFIVLKIFQGILKTNNYTIDDIANDTYKNSYAHKQNNIGPQYKCHLFLLFYERELLKYLEENLMNSVLSLFLLIVDNILFNDSEVLEKA